MGVLVSVGVLFAVPVAAVPSFALAAEAVPPVVIENVRIFDGEEVIAATRVVIEGGSEVGEFVLEIDEVRLG
jgi:hypothetical protein